MKPKNPVLLVFRKEFMELLRDKRVRSGAFFMPVAMMFLIVFMFSMIINSVGKAENTMVHIVKNNDPLMARIRQTKLDIHEVATEAEGVSLIKEGKARLLVVFDPPKHFGAFDQKQIRLRYDAKEERADIAKARFMQSLGDSMKKDVEQRLVDNGMPKEAAEPLKFTEQPVPVGTGKGASGLIVGLLPYLIVLFTFTGGFATAADMVAGEKEKSTLETLLITPVRRTQIVVGKFLAITAVCLLSSASAVVGLALASMAHLPGSEKMMASGLGITPTSGLLILGMMIPLAAFFASILLAVSTYARNMREAQTYLSLVNLIVIFPAVFSQIIGFTDFAQQFWINLVPILNTATNIRLVLQGKSQLLPYATTMGLGIVLATIGIAAAIKLFNREQVLLRV